MQNFNNIPLTIKAKYKAQNNNTFKTHKLKWNRNAPSTHFRQRKQRAHFKLKCL